jgi:hypothetical protein
MPERLGDLDCAGLREDFRQRALLTRFMVDVGLGLEVPARPTSPLVAG